MSADAWPHNELERALQAAAEDERQRPRFGQLLLESDLFCVIPGGARTSGTLEPPPGVEYRTVQAGESFKLWMSRMSDGAEGILAFTSMEVLREWAAAREISDASYVGLRARDLFDMVRGTTILLNVLGPYGKELPPDEVRLLLGGLSLPGQGGSRVATKHIPVQVGPLPEPPKELLEQMVKVLRKESAVRSARCAGIMLEGIDPRPHPMILIEMEEGVDHRGVFLRLKPAIEAWAQRGGAPVDLFDSRKDAEIAKMVVRERPFYVRPPFHRLRAMFGR